MSAATRRKIAYGTGTLSGSGKKHYADLPNTAKGMRGWGRAAFSDGIAPTSIYSPEEDFDWNDGAGKAPGRKFSD